MKGIEPVVAQIRSLAHKDFATLLGECTADSKSVADGLAGLSKQIDDLLRSGDSSATALAEHRASTVKLASDLEQAPIEDQVNVFSEIGRRNPALQAILGADLLELKRVSNELVAIEEEVVALGDTAIDDALDGALLVNKSDEAISSLRRQSQYWDGDLLGSSARDIEHLLRSEAPVNASAARYLGHPIVTARIPVPDSQNAGQVAMHEIHLIPDSIVGDAAGFIGAETAMVAAKDQLALNPGRTILAVYENNSRIHLLEAPVDTSARTIVTRSKFMRRAAQKSMPPELVFNDNNVAFVLTSDSTEATWHKLGQQAPTWPSGHPTPFTRGEMKQNNIGSEYVSRKKQVKASRNGLETMRTEISTSLREKLDHEIQATNLADEYLRSELELLSGLRSTVVAARRVVAASSNLSNKPGTHTALDWELAPIFTEKSGEQQFHRPLAGRSAMTEPLPGASVQEGILIALSKENSPSQHIAVMVDNAGTPHLTSVPAPHGDIADIKPHPDLRAIVDPEAGVFWAIEPGRGKTVSPKRVDVLGQVDNSIPAFPKDQTQRLAELLEGELRNLGQVPSISLEPYSKSAPVKILATNDPSVAAQMLFDEVKNKGHVKPARALIDLTGIVNPGGGKRVFGAARTNLSTTWSRTHDWRKVLHPRIEALVDINGIAFQRQ